MNDSKEVAIGGKYNFDKDNMPGIGFSVDVRNLLKDYDNFSIKNKSGKWVIEDNDE